jgi:predicted O-methyltransferase YrrM
MIDDTFFAKVHSLQVREMGTESTAPLLYWLVRSVRPRNVIEVGMGYSTPFLAQALKDNVADFEAERARVENGQQDAGLSMEYASYYENSYEPRLICIDRMTDAASSATRVRNVLHELELSEMCQIVERDLRGSGEFIEELLGVVDFAWIDTWDTLAFIREYWRLINPAGGILAVHYLMTYPEGRAVIRYIESLRGPEGGRLEVTNIREPHKVVQNSTTLIRRVLEYTEPEDLRPFGNQYNPASVLG